MNQNIIQIFEQPTTAKNKYDGSNKRLSNQIKHQKKEIRLLKNKNTRLQARIDKVLFRWHEWTSKKLKSSTIHKQLRDEDSSIQILYYKQKLLSGVYLLACKNEIVYVGQSVNIHRRIENHTHIKYDTVYYIPVTGDHRLVLEAYWIKKLKPLYNTIGK